MTEPPQIHCAGQRRQPTFLKITIPIILCGLVTIAYRSRPVTPENPLEGDMEEASLGLSKVLEKTPTNKKWTTILASSNSSNPGLRYAAIDVAGTIKTKESAILLKAALRDSASHVRLRALEELVQLDPEQGFTSLLGALSDEDTWMRQAAVNQLSAYAHINPKKAKRAVSLLIEQLHSPDETMPALASGALHRITGNNWVLKSKLTGSEKLTVIEKWDRWLLTVKDQPEFLYIGLPIETSNPTRVDVAPSFSISDLDGKQIDLSTQSKKLTLLNFYGTWCAPCQLEIPDLQKLHSTYSSKGIDIIGIAISEQNGAEGLRKWCAKKGVTYRQALATNAIRDAFGHIDEVPVSILMDGKGNIVRRWEGERDYRTFNLAINRYIARIGSN